jgi:hypothetical protein
LTRVVTKLQFGALGSLLILAGCGGGSAAPASSPAPASAAAKPSTAASVAVSVAPATSAKPAASGAAAAKPSVALPAACSSAPSTAGVPTPLPASPSPKPSFTQQTDVIGEPAPGPYTQIGPQLTVNPGTPGKVYVPGLYFQLQLLCAQLLQPGPGHAQGRHSRRRRQQRKLHRPHQARQIHVLVRRTAAQLPKPWRARRNRRNHRPVGALRKRARPVPDGLFCISRANGTLSGEPWPLRCAACAAPHSRSAARVRA